MCMGLIRRKAQLCAAAAACQFCCLSHSSMSTAHICRNCTRNVLGPIHISVHRNAAVQAPDACADMPNKEYMRCQLDTALLLSCKLWSASHCIAQTWVAGQLYA